MKIEGIKESVLGVLTSERGNDGGHDGTQVGSAAIEGSLMGDFDLNYLVRIVERLQNGGNIYRLTTKLAKSYYLKGAEDALEVLLNQDSRVGAAIRNALDNLDIN
jgi:hypothetical protein